MGRPRRCNRYALLLSERLPTSAHGDDRPIDRAVRRRRVGGAHGGLPDLDLASGGQGPLALSGGAVALVLYGVLATQQASNSFGQVLAAYGGVFVVGSLLWGVAFDGFTPDVYDLAGAIVCLAGVGLIMYAPR